MSILRLEGVRREIGTFVILESVSVTVAHGERIGLVGANGAGKTTLLKIAAGREEPDAGRVVRKSGLSLDLLTQEASFDPGFAGARTVREWVRSGAREAESIERELRELESQGAAGVQGARYEALQERFESLDGYHLDQRVEEALSGLGIAAADWERPPRELSGGEQTRSALARLIVADPDLLMLDEPTNHLDIAAIEWLEVALVRRKGALVVASHDRAFLDAVVGKIWELRDRRLEAFRGDYSSYLAQREERDARLRKDAASLDEAAARERELIQRYRSHRKFTKMHEHEKRLEKLEAQRFAAPRHGPTLRLPGTALLGAGPARSGDVVVSLREVVAGFPPSAGAPSGARGVAVVRVDRLEAQRGERVGIVGPNGAGKTTLLRTIAGQLPPLAGFVKLGAGVHVGYLAQLRGATFAGATVLDALLAAAPVDTGPARSYLARFLFRGEDVFKPVSELSGGERSRLELALLGVTAANLLLLDEPTNHLDIPARESLESFLRESPATLLIVSHDRRLLDSVCDRLWVLEPGTGGEPGGAAPFDGGYREWRAAVGEGWTVAMELERRSNRIDGGGYANGRPRAKPGRPADGDGRTPAPADPTERSVSIAQKAVTKAPRLSKDAYRRQRALVEEDLNRLGQRKSHLELALRDPAVQSNFVELRRLTSELADVDAALAQAEDAWLALAERAPK